MVKGWKVVGLMDCGNPATVAKVDVIGEALDCVDTVAVVAWLFKSELH